MHMRLSIGFFPKLLFCCLLAVVSVHSYGQEAKKIKLLNANSLEVDPSINANKLIGDVIFKHEEALMYCDSAYLFPNNSMKAWGTVRVKQGDSLLLIGDSLHYLGDKRLARIRGRVLVKNSDMTLRTNYLDYDRNKDMAYYLGGGQIVNSAERNTLTSNIGYFFTKENRFFFKDSVRLVNPDYTIESDTLMYNTQSEITYFYGPTRIQSDDNLITCNRGWYDTRNDRSEFSGRAWITSNASRIGGDSVYYDRKQGIGKAYGNVTMIDSTQDLVLHGDYTVYDEKDSTSLITGKRAQMIQLVDADSLYLHADTLFAGWDTSRKHRVVHAWYHVKFFKPDMSGRCDSLVFSNADSTIQLFRQPIIWSDENQITSDSLVIKNYDGKVHWMRMTRNAFIASSEDSLQYNQISGKNMLGHFKDGKLRRVDVLGNGQTIYYATEEDGELIGLNRSDCANMNIYIDSNTVSRIAFLNKPTATLYPLKEITPDLRKLERFAWHDSLRPYHPEHTFYWGAIPDSLKHLRYKSAASSSTADTVVAAPTDTTAADSVAPVDNGGNQPGSRKGLKDGEEAPAKNKGSRKGLKARKEEPEDE